MMVHYNAKNMQSPNFGQPHDNPKAKGPQYEAAIEAFFNRLKLKALGFVKNIIKF